MEITIEARSVWGQTKLYPISDDAKTIAKIAGTTTLTVETLMHAAKLSGASIRCIDKTSAQAEQMLARAGVRFA